METILRFEHPEYLYGILVLPLMLLVFVLMMRWRKNALKAFGEMKVISKLMPDITRGRFVFKFVLLSLVAIMLVIAAANPQIGSKIEQVKRQGIDLVIALDVSNSMMAEDIKPSRLEASKLAISRLIGELKGDRIGIIVFAGKAYTQLPITTDYAAARMFLSTINNNIVPTQGTAIGDAISMAETAFNPDDEHNKAIIVITDGENHEDDAIQEAKAAAEKGIHVYTIGMGLAEGGPIPLYNSRGVQQGFKKDNQGNTVITKLNEEMLRKIADAGDGAYVRANNTRAGVNMIFDEINKLEKSEIESKMFSDYEDRFQIFAGLALALLIFELLILERKTKLQRKFKLFEE